MSRLLLLYSEIDRAAAKAAARALRAEGHRLYVVLAGADALRDEVVKRCDAAVCVISPAALHDADLRAAFRALRAWDVAPVLLAVGPVSGVPDSLACVDASTDLSAGIRELGGVIRGDNAGPPYRRPLVALLTFALLVSLLFGAVVLTGSLWPAENEPLPTLDARLNLDTTLTPQSADINTADSVEVGAVAPGNHPLDVGDLRDASDEDTETPESTEEATAFDTPFSADDVELTDEEITLTLTATLDDEFDDDPPAAMFYAFPDRGDAPLLVEFENDSWGGIAEYAWDFTGDGVIDSTSAEPPPYTYTSEGVFTASLRVTGPDGMVDQMSMEIIVFGEMEPGAGTSTPTPTNDELFDDDPPAAMFYAFPDRGDAPLMVEFENDSWGGIAEYAWDFTGDGVINSTSAQPSPYTYNSPGNYMASLRVTGPDGMVDQMSMEIIVFGELLPSNTPSPTIPPTPTPLPTSTPTPTLTATSTATLTATATTTLTLTAEATQTELTATLTETSTPTATATPTLTVTAEESAAATVTATVTSTLTATVTSTVTASSTSTLTSTSTATATPTSSPPPTSTPTLTSTATATPTFTPTATFTMIPTPTPRP